MILNQFPLIINIRTKSCIWRIEGQITKASLLAFVVYIHIYSRFTDNFLRKLFLQHVLQLLF